MPLPSFGALLFLFFGVPLILAIVLVICLLFSRRGWVELLIAMAVSAAYFVVSITLWEAGAGRIGATTSLAVGFFMLVFSFWAVVIFLAGALYLSKRKQRPPAQAAAHAPPLISSRIPLEHSVPGECFDCGRKIPIRADKCLGCGAVFSMGSSRFD